MSERTDADSGASAVVEGASTLAKRRFDVAFVGDVAAAAPGAEGGALSGAPGHLFDELLGAAGLRRADVLVTALLDRSLPGNREARRDEADAGLARVLEQLAAAGPRVVCTLGNAATRAIRDAPDPVALLHGRPEERVIAGHAVYFVALHHPASALYNPVLVDVLRSDLASLPTLLARPRPALPEPDLAIEPLDPRAGATVEAAAELAQSAPETAPEQAPADGDDELRLF